MHACGERVWGTRVRSRLRAGELMELRVWPRRRPCSRADPGGMRTRVCLHADALVRVYTCDGFLGDLDERPRSGSVGDTELRKGGDTAAMLLPSETWTGWRVGQRGT